MAAEVEVEFRVAAVEAEESRAAGDLSAEAVDMPAAAAAVAWSNAAEDIPAAPAVS
ncbi:MAG: hypothetical protein ABI759_11170 [Candidatus Solibacter sp.]